MSAIMGKYNSQISTYKCDILFAMFANPGLKNPMWNMTLNQLNYNNGECLSSFTHVWNLHHLHNTIVILHLHSHFHIDRKKSFFNSWDISYNNVWNITLLVHERQQIEIGKLFSCSKLCKWLSWKAELKFDLFSVFRGFTAIFILFFFICVGTVAPIDIFFFVLFMFMFGCYSG